MKLVYCEIGLMSYDRMSYFVKRSKSILNLIQFCEKQPLKKFCILIQFCETTTSEILYIHFKKFNYARFLQDKGVQNFVPTN